MHSHWSDDVRFDPVVAGTMLLGVLTAVLLATAF